MGTLIVEFGIGHLPTTVLKILDKVRTGGTAASADEHGLGCDDFETLGTLPLRVTDLHQALGGTSLAFRVVRERCGRLDLAPEFVLLGLERTRIQVKLLAMLKVANHQPEESEGRGRSSRANAK